MARCGKCGANGTRVVREDDPGSRILLTVCRMHGKELLDTQVQQKARPNQKMRIQKIHFQNGA